MCLSILLIHPILINHVDYIILVCCLYSNVSLTTPHLDWTRLLPFKRKRYSKPTHKHSYNLQNFMNDFKKKIGCAL